MEIVIRQSAEELAEVACEAISELYAQKPDAVLGIATGSSPIPIYQALGRKVKAGELSLKQAKAFLLDEYVGIPTSHPECYRTFTEREFVEITDIDTNNVHGPDGLAADLMAACRDYEQAIVDSGGIDLQLLGIGVDGHIGFNEPGASLGSLTHLSMLTHETRVSNARFFDNDIDQVPKMAITQGVGTIMRSRYAILIATGEHKADAIKATIEGPVSQVCTASALQMHPNVKILLDAEAASKLRDADFYREINAAKPKSMTWLGM